MKNSTSLTTLEMATLLKLRKTELMMHTMINVFIFAVIVLVPIEIGVPAWALALIMTSAYFVVFSYTNKSFVLELSKKEKKVYRGVVTYKRITARYKRPVGFLDVNGKVFRVDEDTFYNFAEGENVEVHYSPSTKLVFNVVKI